MILTWQILARGLHLAGLALLWGTLLWSRIGMGIAASPDHMRRAAVIRLARAGAALGLAAGLVWLVLVAAAIGDATSLGEALGLVWPVVTDTSFGHILGARLALLAIALVLRSGWTRLVIAGLALGLQPWLGHAGAGDGPASLAWTEMLHVLAAGAWIGALPALLLSLGEARGAAAAAEAFAPLGLACVAILACSGFLQGEALIGGMAGLFGTDYGHAALAKIALFAVLLGLAALNRFRLTRRVERLGAPALPALRASIAAEFALGLVVIMVASLLASQAPGAHETPVWPFAWRPSLAVWEDPDGRALLYPALGLAAACVVLAGIGAARRRVRWAALSLAAIALTASVPWLSPLLVPAWPSSYATSPTDFAAPSIARGLALYAARCTGCHGAQGRGDGKLAASLPVPPADLTAPHLFAHSDGELFWWISHGMRGPGGEWVMPGIETSAEADEDADDVWALIDAIRARNAGLAYAARGVWPVPMQAPAITAACRDGEHRALSAWRGQVVRVVGARDWTPVAPGAVATIAVPPPDGGGRPPPFDCVAESDEAWTAYATISGRGDGFDCLIDAAGWLRVCGAPGVVDPARIAAIAASPLVAPSGGGHHHG